MKTLRTKILFALGGVLLVASPAVLASLLKTDLVLEEAPLRVGDVLRHDHTTLWTKGDEADETRVTRVTRVEGLENMADAWGVSRSAVGILSEAYWDGELESAERCYQSLETWDVVRRDPLVGGLGAGGLSVMRYGWETVWGEGMELFPKMVKTMRGSTILSRFDLEWLPCDLPPMWPAPTVREGQAFAFSEFTGPMHLSAKWIEVMSSPGRAVRHEGRPALAFTYDLGQVRQAETGKTLNFSGSIEFVVAAGIPGVAKVKTEWVSTQNGTRIGTMTQQAVGYTAGEGPAVPRLRGLLPAEPAAPPSMPYDRLALDDAGYATAYPYEEALQQLLQDPDVGLQAFLDRHPEAFLASALYDRHTRPKSPWSSAVSDGGWVLTFEADGVAYGVATVRAQPPAGLPIQPLARQVGLVENHDGGERGSRHLSEDLQWPERVTSSALLARIAAAQGLPFPTAPWFLYEYSPWTGADIWVSDLPLAVEGRQEGRDLQLAAETGRAVWIWNAILEGEAVEGILSVSAGEPVAVGQGASVLAILLGPTAGAALAGGTVAATGLILLIIVKFVLVPLYTRLVASRLLDHPVRARLHEAVRLEPGIRQAELVARAGVGHGATRRHLAMLVRHGLLFELREAASMGYYVPGEVLPDLARKAVVLRGESTRRVYDLLCQEPALSLREAGVRLGMSAPSVLRHKRKLEKAGLLGKGPRASGSP